MHLSEQHLRALVLGGAVLGAGGGGSIRAGMAAGRRALALGSPELVTLDQLPDDAILVTLSGVGTVQGKSGVEQIDRHFDAALKLFRRTSNAKIDGIIPSEVGPSAVTYGWRESVVYGIPIVDAPCNGRAHPFGLMGSLGLHRLPKHLTTTIAVGGAPHSSQRVELRLDANAAKASRIVRQAVASTGVAMAVIRNPLPASYVRRHAAIGGLRDAFLLGRTLLRHRQRGVHAVLRALSQVSGGTLLAAARVQACDLNNRHGFTLGEIRLRTPSGGQLRIAVCNEYSSVWRNAASLALFPDVITLFDRRSAIPLSTGDVQVGQDVLVFCIPRRHVKLASTMHDRDLLRRVPGLDNVAVSNRISLPSYQAVQASTWAK